MYNKFMNEKEINVKVNNRVMVCGFIGTVTEVLKGFDKEWNGKEYKKVEGTEWTGVKVHFDNTEEVGRQYQDSVYGGYCIRKLMKEGIDIEKH